MTKSGECFIFYSTMVQSMTGFGSAEKDGCRVEIRSINHRFMDVYMRAPAFLNRLEIPLRNILKEHFSRGKFDIGITVSEQAATDLTINTEAVKKICGAFKKVQDDLSIKGELDINALLSLRELFMETNQKYDMDSITDVFKQALSDLCRMRNAEGKALAAEMALMTAALGEMNERIKASFSGVLEGLKEKFNERLGILLEGKDIDGSRILQEAAIIAARLDISEELVRVESHIKQFGEILSAGGIIGRKLDFILQELNREVNTIASKSADYGVSSLTVDMKTAIEKIREQVQNIQ